VLKQRNIIHLSVDRAHLSMRIRAHLILWNILVIFDKYTGRRYFYRNLPSYAAVYALHVLEVFLRSATLRNIQISVTNSSPRADIFIKMFHLTPRCTHYTCHEVYVWIHHRAPISLSTCSILRRGVRITRVMRSGWCRSRPGFCLWRKRLISDNDFFTK